MTMKQPKNKDRLFPACPTCKRQVAQRSLFDMTMPDFLSAAKDGLLEPARFWGGDGSDRAMFSACTKRGFVHFRVGRTHKLAYMRGK